MSDAADRRTDTQSDSAVSMEKKPATTAKNAVGRPERAPRVKQPAATVAVPKTIQWATYAIITQVVFALLHAILARGFTSQLTKLMIKSNNDAKTPEKNFDAVKHLADYRKGLLFQAVVLSLAFIFLAFSLRRSRGASVARWGFLIFSVLVAQTNGPLTILPIADYPGGLQVIRVLMGLASLAAIVLLFLRPSLQYFRECKAANRPEGAPVRPGLTSLFGGRGAGGTAGGRSASGGARGSVFGPRPSASARASSTSSSAASESDSALPPRPKSKAKVRAEADAIAKGAELARTRAKASKSRRTEIS